MRLGFTGTRNGMNNAQARILRRWLREHWNFIEAFHHGACEGADGQAVAIAWQELYITAIVAHPPENQAMLSRMSLLESSEIRPAKPYLDRNHDIVNETHALIATPQENTEQLRSGTWATIRYARKMGRRVIIVGPSGSLEESWPREYVDPDEWRY